MKLDDMKTMAIGHARDVAQLEVEDLRSRLSNLYPDNMPITIQLFQPIEGGRLVDVGPRPKGCDDTLIYQPNNLGKTGDIFVDEQAPHRFIPKSERIGQIPPGTFTKAIIDLEKKRYPNIGNWGADGPPPDATIHQLPLASLPLDLHPRPSNGQYRFANLGAVYTITRKTANDDEKKREKMLILYALRAGEIAQQVRYEAICGGSKRTMHATECRLRVSKHLPVGSWDPSECEAARIDKGWMNNVDGGVCLLVGSLILHHHWWFPYDPVAYQLLCRLRGNREDLAKDVYYQHFSSPPEYMDESKVRSSREIEELVAMLCEDIIYIVRSFRGSASPIQDDQEQQIRSAVLAMLIQFAGIAMHHYCDRVWTGRRLTPQKQYGSSEVRHLGVNPAWPQPLKNLMNQAVMHSPILKPTTLKNEDSEYCEFVRSLLAPHNPPLTRPERSLRDTEGLVCVKDGEGYILKLDRNGTKPHFLYWHTRAMLVRE